TYLRRVMGGCRAWLIATSSAIACAVLLKPTYLAAAPLMIIGAWPFSERRVRPLVADVLSMTVAGAALLGIVALAGWLTGSIGPWYEMAVSYSLKNYVGGVSWSRILTTITFTAARHWHWYTIMALSGFLCWVFHSNKAPLAVVLMVSATVLISAFAQSKGI